MLVSNVATMIVSASSFYLACHVSTDLQQHSEMRNQVWAATLASTETKHEHGKAEPSPRHTMHERPDRLV